MRALAQSQTLARTSRRGPWCSARRAFAFSSRLGIATSGLRGGCPEYLVLRIRARLVPGADERAEPIAQVRAGGGGGDGKPEVHELVLIGGHRIAGPAADPERVQRGAEARIGEGVRDPP